MILILPLINVQILYFKQMKGIIIIIIIIIIIKTFVNHSENT